MFNSSVFELNWKEFFIEEEEIRGNSFFVVSMFNWGCWGSKNNLFIKRVIRLDKGFSKRRTALDRFS